MISSKEVIKTQTPSLQLQRGHPSWLSARTPGSSLVEYLAVLESQQASWSLQQETPISHYRSCVHWQTTKRLVALDVQTLETEFDELTGASQGRQTTNEC